MRRVHNETTTEHQNNEIDKQQIGNVTNPRISLTSNSYILSLT